MAKFKFTRAVRKEVQLRVMLMGPSGSGKTYTGLAVGHHLLLETGKSDQRVAVIDSEVTGKGSKAQGSATKYAGEHCLCRGCQGHGVVFDFDTVLLPDGSRSPDDYCEAMIEAANAGYGCLLIDGMSHAWQALLSFVDQLKAQNPRNDPWLTARPIQNKFIETMMTYPGHLIATCRTKEKLDYQQKNRPSLGHKPVQTDGIEYEFDVALFTHEATSTVVKTRASVLRNNTYQEPGADLAHHLFEWALAGNRGEETAAEAAQRGRQQPALQQQQMQEMKDRDPDPTPRSTSGGSGAKSSEPDRVPESAEEAQQPAAELNEADPFDDNEEVEALKAKIRKGSKSLDGKNLNTAKTFFKKAGDDVTKLTKLAGWVEDRLREKDLREAEARADEGGPMQEDIHEAETQVVTSGSKKGFAPPQE